MRLLPSLIPFCAVFSCAFLGLTYISYIPPKTLLSEYHGQRLAFVDQNGTPLNHPYCDAVNAIDYRPLYYFPRLLQEAVIFSEDKRFYRHSGIDVLAKAVAAIRNIGHFILSTKHTRRGASTITEQVVRILHPNPRTLWSKWIEAVTAYNLEMILTKEQILEIYMNQLPYSGNRRGLVQAARYYFDKHINVLTNQELLALIILARFPSNVPSKVEILVQQLNHGMYKHGFLTDEQKNSIISSKKLTFTLSKSFEKSSTSSVAYFINFAKDNISLRTGANFKIHTTLDLKLQENAQVILDESVKRMCGDNVHNGAILIINHRTNEILSWNVTGQGSDSSSSFNAVLIPRLPGSVLKPFLYALAITKGWGPLTMLEDAPMATQTKGGFHRFFNYSHKFYGPITLREALGNSLNIPALQTIDFVGTENYLNLLRTLGFSSLRQSADIYGKGLALGNGEVSLFEVVQAYGVLARGGLQKRLNFLQNYPQYNSGLKYSDNYISGIVEKEIFSKKTSLIITDILSDQFARRLEFGRSSVLNFPNRTAVKTGTSSNYKDSWALGFDSHYVVGVWLGNLDNSSMNKITGGNGAAPLLRALFTRLPKVMPYRFDENTGAVEERMSEGGNKGLNDVSVELQDKGIPKVSQRSSAPLLIPSTIPTFAKCRILKYPLNGSSLMIDQNIPREYQSINFVNVIREPYIDGAKIYIDGQVLGATVLRWQLERGSHRFEVGTKFCSEVGWFVVK